MRLIAVSQRVDDLPERGERRDALDQRLAAWLAAAGLAPLPVPNTGWEAGGLEAWLTRLAPAGILLSGGNDIGAAPERDVTESRLLDWAAARALPVLGLCRGMQMLAHRAGTALEEVLGHVASRHPLVPEAGTDNPPWPEEVNSYHRWGLYAAPADYLPLARAPDGSLEAMVHRHLPWQGWMWHPEREARFHPADLARLKQLLGSPRHSRKTP